MEMKKNYTDNTDRLSPSVVEDLMDRSVAHNKEPEFTINYT